MTTTWKPLSSLITSLTERVANQTSTLTSLTLTLPLNPVLPIAALVEHITAKPVHELYFPFLRFGVIHAARVSTVWAGLIRGQDRRGVSVLQDLVGYLTLACTSGQPICQIA